MEYIDIVDENDNVIGKAEKKEIYEKSFTHRIVHVLVFNDKGEMLLQYRDKNHSYCPHHWSTSVGGHVQSGENYEAGAIREYKEELGCLTKIKFFAKDFYKDSLPNRPCKFIVTFKTINNGPFNIEKRAIEKVCFFPIKEIQKMINNKEKFHPELLFLLKKYFDMVNLAYLK